MGQKFQGIFLAITLLLGAVVLPINSTTSVGFNQAFAVEVGGEVETEVEVKVGSDDDSTEAEATSETKAQGEVKTESEMDSESEMESKSALEIEVYVSENKATIEIEMNGEEKVYVLNTSSQAEIIAKIQSETSFSESEIKSIWEYNQDSEIKDHSSEKSKMELEAKIAAKIAGITNASIKAKERAKILVTSMEEKSKESDKRFHEILLKAKAQGYMTSKTSNNETVKSYSMNLDGMAKSQSETTSSLEGSLYMESMQKASNVSKYKISGGQILIDGETYDVLFGKARATSNNDAKVGSNMILIAEVMKPNGEVTTMKMLMQSESSLTSQTEVSSWSVKNPQSKIAGTWKMDAQATMSMTSA